MKDIWKISDMGSIEEWSHDQLVSRKGFIRGKMSYMTSNAGPEFGKYDQLTKELGRVQEELKIRNDLKTRAPAQPTDQVLKLKDQRTKLCAWLSRNLVDIDTREEELEGLNHLRSIRTDDLAELARKIKELEK